MSAPAPEPAGSGGPTLGGVAAWLAVLLAALVFGLGSQRYALLAPAYLGLALLPWVPDRLRRKVHLFVYLAVGALFAIWQQSTSEIMSGLGATRFHGVFFAGYACLACAVIALANPRRVRSRLPMAALCGLAALCFAGGGLPNWLHNQESWRSALPWLGERLSPRAFYALSVAVYSLLALAAFRGGLGRVERASAAPARPTGLRVGAWRAALLGCAFVLSLGLTEGAASTTRSKYEDLSRAYLSLVRGLRLSASGGFSGQAEFGDVIAEQGIDGGRGVALEVLAAQSPGYLRGRAFLRYTGRGWDVGASKVGVVPERDELGRWLYPGRAEPGGRAPELIVRPVERYEAVFFAPLQAQAIACAGDKVRQHAGSVLHPFDAPASGGYRVWLAETPTQAEGRRAAYLELPEDPALLAALDQHIAEAGLRGLPLPALVERLVAHFEARYEYRFGITFEEGSDPLTQFLKVKKHGHCELFASSGALILRRLGIPARYVTGFVCTERNEYDPELWVARNRMAHAWVEVHDPRVGWQTLEFTPSSGLPAPGTPSWSEALWEWLHGQWTRFSSVPWSELPGYLAGRLQAFVLWLVGAWWRIALLVLGAAGGLVWRLRGRGATPEPELARTFSAPVARARADYLQAEARLAVHGLGRAPAETLLGQAARLEQAPWPPGLDLPRAEALRGIAALAALRYAPGAGAEAQALEP